jgi:hypothetical protein
LAAKKQALSEFQAQKRKEEREEKRKKEEKLKDIFIQMLKDCEHLTSRMTWRKAMVYLEGDSRINVIPGIMDATVITIIERDKELVFEEYMIQREREQKVY